MADAEFKVGDVVKDPWGRTGTIRKIGPGLATGRLVHSVKYPKDKGWGFYYANEIKHV